MEIANQIAVVTGAGSGIGAALARAFDEREARHVVVADLDLDRAASVAESVGGSAVRLDVRDEEAIVELVADTQRHHGPIGIFASNAGFVTAGGLEDTNERIQDMWEVHVMSHIYAARAVVPSMAAHGGGYLLNTASAAGLLTQIGSLAYSITKHAAVALAEWLAITHRHQGIGVSVLCPQAVRTDILVNSPDDLAGDADDPWEGGVASGDGVLDPDVVAAACCEAIEHERFHVLPHEEVARYVAGKGADIERWLDGMMRLQDAIAQGGPLPGDAVLHRDV